MKKIPQQVLVFAGSVALAIIIIVVFVSFSQPTNRLEVRERILIADSKTGELEPVRISEIKPNTSYHFAYPPSFELKNENAYQTFILIRLPEEIGGGKNDTSAFRAYSALSINSHCIMKYWPQDGRKKIEDSCHGDMIRPQDGLFVANSNLVKSGIFVAQPYLDLSSDSQGHLYVEPPVWDMDKNGVVGIGRKINQDDFQEAAISDFENYIKSVGKDLEIPSILSDGTFISPGSYNAQFIYRHPQDTRIMHGVDISFCNCSDRERFRGHGSTHFQVWNLGQERIYTDEWLYEWSSYHFSKVTFYRNGYEIVFSGPSLERTLDLVFDNFYPGKNRSMLE